MGKSHWWGFLRKIYYLEELDIDKRIILKWVFGKRKRGHVLD
jgi:hypothetical protein